MLSLTSNRLVTLRTEKGLKVSRATGGKLSCGIDNSTWASLSHAWEGAALEGRVWRKWLSQDNWASGK
jgi:hypothetical protein